MKRCQSFELRLLNRVTYFAKNKLYICFDTLCCAKVLFFGKFFFPVAVNRISINRRTIDYDMKKNAWYALAKKENNSIQLKCVNYVAVAQSHFLLVADWVNLSTVKWYFFGEWNIISKLIKHVALLSPYWIYYITLNGMELRSFPGG